MLLNINNINPSFIFQGCKLTFRFSCLLETTQPPIFILYCKVKGLTYKHGAKDILSSSYAEKDVISRVKHTPKRMINNNSRYMLHKITSDAKIIMAIEYLPHCLKEESFSMESHNVFVD